MATPQYVFTMQQLGKTYPGGKQVLKDITLSFLPDAKIGVVGVNGAGKSTLMKIMAGLDTEFTGEAWSAEGIKVGYLSQEPELDASKDVMGNAMEGVAEAQAMLERYNELAMNYSDETAEEMAELQDKIEAQDIWDLESKVEMAMDALRCPEGDADVAKLSGGEKRRVALCRLLLAQPGILLLDEPTNHLDILSIRWLETFLRDFKGTVVVVSHDHRFLDNVCTTILDVDYETVIAYPGNYGDFQEAKQSERDRREKDLDARERDIAHHQKFVDRFRAKASKARQAQSKLRMIEKKAEGLQALPQSSRRYPTFRFEPRRDSGREVLTIKGIAKAFGDNEVLHGVDLTVNRGDRLAVMGPNGIGKSTLLNRLVGAKISIVTHKVQTTRSRVRGVVIDGDCQIVFVDTPGIFTPKRRLERSMVAAAWGEARDADEIVLIVDATRSGLDRDTRLIIKGLKARDRTAVLMLNKVDLCKRERLLPLAAAFEAEGVFSRIFMISALSGDGVEDVQRYLTARMPDGP